MNSCIVQKEFRCPLCEKNFRSPRVRPSKIKLIGTDNDLRPYHLGVDTISYEVVSCEHCGFTTIAKKFVNFEDNRISAIKDALEKYYKPFPYLEELDAASAIPRFVLAIKLLPARCAKDSEYHYLYLRLAWLYRVLLHDPNSLQNEFLATKKSLEYAELAFAKENPPILDMDNSIFTFLIGEMARRVGQLDKALKYINMVILDSSSNQRIRERARDTKELIRAEMNRQKENNSITNAT